MCAARRRLRRTFLIRQAPIRPSACRRTDAAARVAAHSRPCPLGRASSTYAICSLREPVTCSKRQRARVLPSSARAFLNVTVCRFARRRSLTRQWNASRARMGRSCMDTASAKMRRVEGLHELAPKASLELQLHYLSHLRGMRVCEAPCIVKHAAQIFWSCLS